MKGLSIKVTKKEAFNIRSFCSIGPMDYDCYAFLFLLFFNIPTNTPLITYFIAPISCRSRNISSFWVTVKGIIAVKARGKYMLHGTSFSPKHRPPFVKWKTSSVVIRGNILLYAATAPHTLFHILPSPYKAHIKNQ